MPTSSRPNFLVVAASARFIVQAIVAAGYTASAVDGFADLETQHNTEHCLRTDLSHSGALTHKVYEHCCSLMQKNDYTALVFGPGTESCLDVLQQLTAAVPLAGNQMETMRRCAQRSYFDMQSAALHDFMIPLPMDGGLWVRRANNSSGGGHAELSNIHSDDGHAERSSMHLDNDGGHAERSNMHLDNDGGHAERSNMHLDNDDGPAELSNIGGDDGHAERSNIHSDGGHAERSNIGDDDGYAERSNMHLDSDDHQGSQSTPYLAASVVSQLFVAAHGQTKTLGFSAQWQSQHNPRRPFCFGGAINCSDLDVAASCRAERCADYFARTLSLRGLNNIDYLWNGQHLYFLELNPRPSSSMQLYEDVLQHDLFAVHWQACRSSIPCVHQLQTKQPTEVRAYAPIYMQTDCSLPAGFDAWPEGTTDRPDTHSARLALTAGQPLCTVTASGDSSNETLTLLQQRTRQVLAAVGQPQQCL